ncbi:MAG: magnesium transporter [Planctomycetota bacterium]|nr:magnesium transporter [Planctomycetota bacterium]
MTLAPPHPLEARDLHDAWRMLSQEERAEGFALLPVDAAQSFFQELPTLDQARLLMQLPPAQRKLWMGRLEPDDAVDVLQQLPLDARGELMGYLNQPTRVEVAALLAYAEDEAGGLMSTRFARLRPEMTIEEATHYLRLQARDRLEHVYYAYVLDAEKKLVGVLSVRELFRSEGSKRVKEAMKSDLVTIPEDMDQEHVAGVLAKHDFLSLPVVDPDGHMKGIVTFDDIVDVVQEEATEDIQKLGGMEALDLPYLQTGLFAIVRKRAVWLAVLFLGEMLTATAMAHYEEAIASAVILAVFVPLIISSGGNSGSQATTLIIRAMALGEVTLGDWWRVIRRELAAGLLLGSILAPIGFLRIVAWEFVFHDYGEHYLAIACTVAGSLMGVVIFGTLAGSMLPFLLRRLGFDPASASAPFVATFVDVSGVILYFSIAKAILSGTLL